MVFKWYWTTFEFLLETIIDSYYVLQSLEIFSSFILSFLTFKTFN